MAGRKSQLNDPDFARQIAELYVRGVSREEMAEELGCHRDTISVWVKDPRVAAHARKIAVDRATRISRRIDSEMEGRLAYISTWEIDTILKVRKEYLDRPLKVAAGEDVDTAKATNELAEALDQNPDLAKQLAELLEG